jgi:hypothetical protein
LEKSCVFAALIPRRGRAVASANSGGDAAAGAFLGSFDEINSVLSRVRLAISIFFADPFPANAV